MLAGLLISSVASAGDPEERPHPPRNLTQVERIAVVIDPSFFRRENLDEVCTAALAEALKQREFTVVANSLSADAVLALKGSALIITEGKPKEIGRTVLNYVATVEPGTADKSFFTYVGWARGGTAAEACKIAAEDIASRLGDAKQNTDEDEGMEEDDPEDKPKEKDEPAQPEHE